MPFRRPVRRVAILGAGLSGLSLALRLLPHEGRPEIVVVDRRDDFARDRTWCAWETAAWPISGAARRRWATWRVVADGREAVHRGSSVPYTCWSSDAVHADALRRLERAGGVQMRLGERVRGIDPDAGTVTTDRGGVEADLVIDALAASSPLARRGRAAEPSATPALVQSFLGVEVVTEQPVFTPGVVDLMDFDALPAAAGLVRFLYVLPFTETRALVEDTTFGAGALAPARRRAALADHLARLGAGAWTTIHEERGTLPMSLHARDGAPWPDRRGARCWTAGWAAGALRPSSGYALARIQRHATAMAEAIVEGRRRPPAIGRRRVDALDAVLLRALAEDPAAGPVFFRDLVARTSPEGFARFMSDASTVADEARVITAAPLARFAGTAVGALLSR